jgi:two-component system, sensor histidine kinase
MEELGADVCVARDGLEALDVLASRDVDLVLCDLRMPRMGGLEFIRKLHAMVDRPHPPVIAMTGIGSAVDRRRTQKAGFKGHLHKPFQARDLLVAIGAAIGPGPYH